MRLPSLLLPRPCRSAPGPSVLRLRRLGLDRRRRGTAGSPRGSRREPSGLRVRTWPLEPQRRPVGVGEGRYEGSASATPTSRATGSAAAWSRLGRGRLAR